MITSSALIESGAKVDLPKVSKTETTSRNVVITLTTKHEIYINQTRVPEGRFKEELKKALSESSDKSVILEGDKDALLGDTVRILATAKEAGAEHISIAAQSEEKPQ
jgi:biopolymer transport protein ExbD